MKIVLLTFLVFELVQTVTAQDQFGVSYGPEQRQFLDIYQAPASGPTPLFIYAHPNGGNTSLPSSLTNGLKDIGVTTISWESLTSVGTLGEVQTGWDDAELMFQWVHDNAVSYNLDTSCIVISGSSRGSILSWKIGHSGDPDIKGLYMYNALPDGIWAEPTIWSPIDEINTDSPPILFVYRYEPGTTDSHDPENGITIMEEYESLGIGDRDSIIHSIEYTSNNDRFQFVEEFVESVGCANTNVNVAEFVSDSYELLVYPNPFRTNPEIVGLSGNETLRVYDAMGKLQNENDDLKSLSFERLSAGIYYLEISSNTGREIIKLAKE